MSKEYVTCPDCGETIEDADGLELHQEVCLKNKFFSDDPKCAKCGTSLDYCEQEFRKTWWECPKCGNIENEKSW